MSEAPSSASPFQKDNLYHLQKVLEPFNPAVKQNTSVIAF